MKIIYNSQEREISKNTSIKEAFKEEIRKKVKFQLLEQNIIMNIKG